MVGEFARVVGEVLPRWVLVENVPGLLSSNRGRDFFVIVERLVQLGYGVAWRVLNAQYFGVPQRRRRVFIVGCLGDRTGAAKVLFEPESCAGHPPPRREKGQEVAGTIGSGAEGSGWRDDLDRSGAFIVNSAESCARKDHARASNTARCLDQTGGFAASQGGTIVTCPLTGNPYGDNEARESLLIFNPHRTLMPDGSVAEGFKLDSIADALHAPTGNKEPLVFQTHFARNGRGAPDTTVPALTSCEGGTNADSKPHIFGSDMAVRRLLPIECLRLQGLPDDWLDLNPPLDDSAKYRMIGNAVAVPVAEWLGRQFLRAIG